MVLILTIPPVYFGRLDTRILVAPEVTNEWFRDPGPKELREAET